MADEKKFYIYKSVNKYDSRPDAGKIVTTVDAGQANEAVTVGDETFDGTKVEISFPVPMGDTVEDIVADARELYDMPELTMPDLLAILGRQLSYRPNWKAIASAKVKDDGMDWEEAYDFLADVVENFKLGKRELGESKAKKAKAFDTIKGEAAELGLTPDQLLAEYKKLKGLE